jgi:putative tryptophan/tyrosine transport system substrate-binding protein
MVNRRSAVRGLVGALGAVPGFVRAQARSGALIRLATLSTATPEGSKVYIDALVQALADLGYVEGRNVVFAHRFAYGDLQRLPGLAAELLEWSADLFISGNYATTYALKQVTRVVPIVMTAVADPVIDGLIDSLSRPGGNITGLTFATGPEILGKKMQLLKEVVPGLSVLGVLIGPAGNRDARQTFETTANALGLKCVISDAIRQADQINDAFEFLVRQGCDGFFDAAGPVTHLRRQQVADLGLAHRLAGMTSAREYAVAGLLMTHGPNLIDLFRRSALHVDKILRGAKPSELPVELPSRFDIVINLKTAKALGLRVPQAVLLQATEIIEETRKVLPG